MCQCLKNALIAVLRWRMMLCSAPNAELGWKPPSRILQSSPSRRMPSLRISTPLRAASRMPSRRISIPLRIISSMLNLSRIIIASLPRITLKMQL